VSNDDDDDEQKIDENEEYVPSSSENQFDSNQDIFVSSDLFNFGSVSIVK
jgi:hypothetical protein